MNIPLEAPCDQSDLLREPGNAAADAAQRDLFEYFAAPVTEACAPPAAAPNAAAAEEDEDVAWHDQILASHDETADDEISTDEPESPDEIAACDPVANAIRSEVAALDEMSKANLHRLETTLSWLNSEAEACRLPPAAPLPAVPGLPGVGPIVDRGMLDSPLHQAPPVPAWLREPQPVPRLAPPRRGRVSWPRAMKVLMACAIAAPLAYYFAVTASPLQKRLAEIVGLASPDAPVARRSATRGGLRMSTAAPESGATAQMPALVATPEWIVIVEASGSPKLPQADTAIRPSPVAEAPAISAPAVPAQTVESEAPLVEAPPVETARVQIVTPPDSAPVVEAKASSTTTAERQDVKLLIDQGKQFFDAGDLIAARILFLRAANAGDAAAAVAMGATYDPVVLADRGVLGPAADLDKARSWYERAKEMGSPEGPRRLEMLANR